MSTELVMILDRSGSMGALTEDVIGGYNSFVSEQKKLKGKTLLTTILFDDQYEVLYDGVPINSAPLITNKEYFVRGFTALYDAIGKAICSVSNRANKKHKVLFVINTDGFENASQEYRAEQIREMVKFRENHDGWKFIFLGANIDSFAVGGNLGITYNFNVQNTAEGISANYAAVSQATRSWTVSNGTSLDTTELKNISDSTQTP